MTFKIICLVLISMCAIGTFIAPHIISEKKYQNHTQRIKIITRVRLGLFLGMLILLFLCLVIR